MLKEKLTETKKAQMHRDAKRLRKAVETLLNLEPELTGLANVCDCMKYLEAIAKELTRRTK
jgi:hypothetical protein